ncbi:MAG: hypothetical protein ACREHD_00755 [Pirellulales bacterium]
MGATNKDSILRSLDLNAALIESLPESVLSDLIGFIEYDNMLAAEDSDDGRSRHLAACREVALSDR